MMTVGYGDVYAVSPLGRGISILNAIWGAFVISLLVASIGRVLELSDNQKKALAEITNTRRAAALVRAGVLHYNAKTEMRDAKILDSKDYVPSAADIAKLKDEMNLEADKMRNERKETKTWTLAMT